MAPCSTMWYDVDWTCLLGATTEVASNGSCKVKPVAVVAVATVGAKQSVKVVPIETDDGVQSFEGSEVAVDMALAVQEGSGKLAARLEIDVAAAVANCPPSGPQR
jgi:hypothetical protein